GCCAVAGGVTLRTSLSWNRACSVVFGAALCSSVPLPCWLSWARKSACLGFSSLLNVDRVISSVLLTWLGGSRVKPMPRIRAMCTAAARNSVKPRRSAGRTAAVEVTGGLAAAFIVDRVCFRMSRSLPGRSGRLQATGAKLPLASSFCAALAGDAVHQALADGGVEGRIDLADAGRAGDVDFRQVLADHVQANEDQALLAQRRAHGGGNLAITLGQWACLAAPAGGQVAAGLARRGNARQAVGHRFAVDHQDALVAVLDRRQIALGHDLLAAVLGQRLENHRKIGVPFTVAKDHRAAHAVQGFENDVTVLFGKLAQNIGSPADQGGRGVLRELGGEELFIAVAQALRPIDHQHAIALRLF